MGRGRKLGGGGEKRGKGLRKTVDSEKEGREEGKGLYS